MSAATPQRAGPSGDDRIPPQLYRVSVEKCELMAEPAFSSRAIVYLINGFLVTRKTQSPPYCFAANVCAGKLRRLVPARQ